MTEPSGYWVTKLNADAGCPQHGETAAWIVDAPSWPPPHPDVELSSDEILDVLDRITPEVYASALANLAKTEIPAAEAS